MLTEAMDYIKNNSPDKSQFRLPINKNDTAICYLEGKFAAHHLFGEPNPFSTCPKPYKSEVFNGVRLTERDFERFNTMTVTKAFLLIVKYLITLPSPLVPEDHYLSIAAIKELAPDSFSKHIKFSFFLFLFFLKFISLFLLLFF